MNGPTKFVQICIKWWPKYAKIDQRLVKKDHNIDKMHYCWGAMKRGRGTCCTFQSYKLTYLNVLFRHGLGTCTYLSQCTYHRVILKRAHARATYQCCANCVGTSLCQRSWDRKKFWRKSEKNLNFNTFGRWTSPYNCRHLCFLIL